MKIVIRRRIITTLSAAIRTLLYWLFPKYALLGDGITRIKFGAHRRDNQRNTADIKRIFDAQYFPIYFRGAVPAEMFSNFEINQVISNLKATSTDAEVDDIFKATLSLLPAGHAKRIDFLWKLASASEKLDAAHVERIAIAAAQHASEYQYDLINVGEPAYALNIVFIAAQKLSASNAQRVLKRALFCATDDTFAIRLLEYMELRDRNKILTDYSNIDVENLGQVFVESMRKQYGLTQSNFAQTLSQADWHAFRRWASTSDGDGQIEQDFWRRFITSRKSLAQAIDFIYPANVGWENGPGAVIEGLLPLSEFRRFLDNLPETDDLDTNEIEGIARMQALLDHNPSADLPRIATLGN
jgi:DNA-binding transcriptional regulator YiaG